MARARHGDTDPIADIRERLTTLPQRLSGQVPGASRAEALEDLVLVVTLVLGGLLVCIFITSSFFGHDNPERAWAQTGPAYTRSAGGPDPGARTLTPVKGLHADEMKGQFSGGGGGGGGGGDGGGKNPCDPDLRQTVRATSGLRILSFWQHRGQIESCPENH